MSGWARPESADADFDGCVGPRARDSIFCAQVPELRE